MKYTTQIPVQQTRTVEQSTETNYPNGVSVPLGLTFKAFRPPLRGEKFIAADTLKGKNNTGRADSRVVVAKQNNSAGSSARVIVY